MARDGHKSNIEGILKSNAERRLEAKHKYEGMKLKTKYGTPFIVKEYIDFLNVIIEFPFSGIQYRTSADNLVTNPPAVPDPFYKQNGHHRPFVFKNPEDEYLGLVFQNSYGEKYKIVEYNNYRHVTVEFLDEHKYRFTTDYNNVKNGKIKNVYRLNAEGGYVGEGTLYRGKEYNWLTNIWNGILIRCNRKDKMHKMNLFAYDNCAICDEWLDYSVFVVDYMNKFLALNPEFDYHIDKDLLYDKYKDKTNGLKYYSNETTVLLPKELNTAIKNIMNSCMLIRYPYRYILQYQRFLDFKSKVIWYKTKNGISEVAFNALIELADNKIEEMKQKFPEYEQMRIEKESPRE